MDEFLILLQAKLDEAKSKSNVNADIKELQNQLDKLKVQIELDPKSIAKIVKQLESALGQKIKLPNISVDSKIGQQIGNNIGQNIVDGISKSSGKVNAEVQKIANQVNKIQLLSNGGIKNDYATQLAVLEGRFSRLGFKESEIAEKTEKVNVAFNALKQRISQQFDESNFQEIITLNDKLQKELIKSQNELTRLGASIKMATDSSRLNNVNQMQKWADNNGKAMKKWGTEINDIIAKMGDLNVQMPKLESDRLLNDFKKIKNEAIETGNVGMTTAQKFKNAWDKIGGWSIVAGALRELTQAGRKMYEAVVKVNSAMIELRKVSDASASEIKRYFDDAAKSAKRYGSTVSDMINATADWSRLGFNLPDSKKLAEIATLYTNVGDGIDMNTANEHLISTLQGFQLEAEDALGIIDRFNEVANNFPIDTAGIGEALQRSAASFYAANTDLSKSIALITGTNSVVQDPDSVGTMWKTVSMRLRGVTQELEAAGLETEGMVESTAQLRDLIQGLTGFDIMADEAGTQFKDIFDIVVGIGHEWKNLTDVEQAGLLEALAGKRQGNALSAALNNISMIEEAYQTAENSAGSALEEQEKYEQGIEYSLDRLEAVFQTFANHILNSNFLKGIIDFGSGTIEVIDKVTSKLGSLETIGLGTGLFAGLKNVGSPKMFGFFFCLRIYRQYISSTGYSSLGYTTYAIHKYK